MNQHTKRPTTYPFEGQDLSLSQVCAMVPALSRQAVKRGLDAGRNTIIALCAYDHRAAPLAAARRSMVTRGKATRFGWSG